MKRKCTLCGQWVDKGTKLIGLGGTPDGWECEECENEINKYEEEHPIERAFIAQELDPYREA